MWKKIQKILLGICDILELLTALIVGLGILVALVALIPQFMHFWENRQATESFMIFLESVLTVVIGIEFMKMLCKPSPEYIMEGLIFLMARHMIVGTTSSGEDLLYILGIAILFLLSRYMVLSRKREEKAASTKDGRQNLIEECKEKLNQKNNM